MPDGLQIPTGWHGFHSLMAFVRATMSLGAAIGGVLYVGMTYGLDSRYASKHIEQTALETQQSVFKFQKALLEGQLFDMKVRECSADTQALRQQFAARVSVLSNQYVDLVGRDPLIPSCDSLR